MKVAFYLHNGCYNSKQNYSNLLAANPGIGGSEYEILLIAYALTIRNNGIDVLFYAAQGGNFPSELKVEIEPSLDTAIQRIYSKGCNILVFDRKQIKWSEYELNNLPPDFQLIPWCHTFYNTSELNATYRNSHIAKLICVGTEQVDIFRDHKAFYKTEYIYNCVPVNYERVKQAKLLPNNQREHIVTFVGSLNPIKTFHVLAEIWPTILSRVPDAQLYVIGSAGLYTKGAELGKFGIAEKYYEESFIPYITQNGKLLDSVHFVGALGEEKNDILLRTKVGVPNPTGRTETFCIVAVEMQLMGCSVASMTAPGYFDTIYNGYMVKRNKKALADAIVKLLLNDPPRSYEETLSYIENNYSVDVIAKEWEQFLSNDLSKRIHPQMSLKHGWFRLKWLKEFVRIAKKCLPILNRIPYTVENLIVQKEKRMDIAYRIN